MRKCSIANYKMHEVEGNKLSGRFLFKETKVLLHLRHI